MKEVMREVVRFTEGWLKPYIITLPKTGAQWRTRHDEVAELHAVAQELWGQRAKIKLAAEWQEWLDVYSLLGEVDPKKFDRFKTIEVSSQVGLAPLTASDVHDASWAAYAHLVQLKRADGGLVQPRLPKSYKRLASSTSMLS